jgi:hypothetical protein
MKRVLTLIAGLCLVAGGVSVAQTADPEPATAHASPVEAVCRYSKPPNVIFQDWRGVHYEGAHIYLCKGIVLYAGFWQAVCWMIIEGDPHRYDYPPSGPPGPTGTCW